MNTAPVCLLSPAVRLCLFSLFIKPGTWTLVHEHDLFMNSVHEQRPVRLVRLLSLTDWDSCS